MKFAAFDLEISKILPENAQDIKKFAPLGISCAAVAFSDKDDVVFWQGVPQLSKPDCKAIVQELQRIVYEGYTLLTWNGCSFDFFVLAQESGLVEECGELALNHVDLMLIVTFTKGYYLALDKALAGAGVKGKLKKLTLSNGTKLENMSGSLAPELWAEGEYLAVLEYLRSDVTQLIELAKVLETRKSIQWQSNSGRIQSVKLSKFLLVEECFSIPEPDVSWMDTTPPSREQFVEWIPTKKKLIANKRKVKGKVSSQKKIGSRVLVGCLGSIVTFFGIAIACGVFAIPIDNALFKAQDSGTSPLMCLVTLLAIISSMIVFVYSISSNAKIWQTLKSKAKDTFTKLFMRRK